MEGVVNEVTPVPPVNTLPPVAAAYQSTVSPAPTVALITTVPVPERLDDVPTGAEGTFVTVTVLVAVVILQLITVCEIVTVPGPTPVTTPELLTVATELLLEVQVPPEIFVVTVPVEPTQTEDAPARTTWQ